MSANFAVLDLRSQFLTAPTKPVHWAQPANLFGLEQILNLNADLCLTHKS
ncbi:hypothetical protein ON05_000485 [Acaryochloris sp. CCMEE 5410]|nr:hypothetical protein ON05_000485 [Acaryochloris sp. CCMEE 5410]